MILVNFQIHYHKTTDSIYRKCNDTKEVFRSRNQKKDRQHDGQKKTKRTNNKDQKEKELSTKHYIEKLNIEQHESNSNRFSGKISSSCSTSGICRFTAKRQ